LLYVQPLYLQAESGRIPELKRVILGNETKIAWGESLEQALTKLFGNGAAPVPLPPGETMAGAGPAQQQTQPTSPPPGQPSAQSGLAAQALQQYNQAEQALKEGNWTKYGEELKKLRATLEELNKQK
jgi:uncharacterized membrane protein (UPF0182 family)